MRAAHTCFRSALTQAFRPSLSDAAAASSACTVPAFLVPACARIPNRSISTTQCHKAEAAQTAPRCPPPPQTHRRPREASQYKSATLLSRSRIPFPDEHARADVDQWLLALDPCLPSHLRKGFSNGPDASASISPIDLALFILAAQDHTHAILSHMAIGEQRWDAAVWIVKKLIADETQPVHALLDPKPFVSASMRVPEQQSEPLNHLTRQALRSPLIWPCAKSGLNLDQLTSRSETVDPKPRLVKRALGQVWRMLGNMILTATEDGSPDSDLLMHRVLEMIAYLHHMGMIPDSVYAPQPTLDNYALQQPPTLHVLSSKILTALSDAQWRSHEASVKVATERLNASYFLGHEIPGSRYKIQVTEVAPELWLELVLWSCIHGGWTQDGAYILDQVFEHCRGQPWGLTSWKEMLQAEAEKQDAQIGWSIFRSRDEPRQQEDERARMRRKISAEVVTAFVDASVNDIRLGVGNRGSTPEDIIRSLKSMKTSLDTNSLSLGSTTWDAIMARLVDSGSIVPENRPEILLSVLELASTFGSEVGAVNASKVTSPGSEPPYFFEPTTVPISLLHRTLRSFIRKGDVDGAVGTLQKLQEHTDWNKQRSLEQFFASLKSIPLGQGQLFSSRLPPIEFPAFETQLSIPLLAKLLDLTTSAQRYDLARHFLFAEDIDGPLISPEAQGHFVMAASIIRFGAMAGEHDLVLDLVNKTSMAGHAPGSYRMPHEFLTALICVQIQLRRWTSVQGMLHHVLESPGYKVDPVILAQFGAELVRLSSPIQTGRRAKAESEAHEAFTGLLATWESLILHDVKNELFCVLAILSTVDKKLHAFCLQFLGSSARQGMELSTDHFNVILGGVLDRYGSVKAMQVVKMWCYQSHRRYGGSRAPGGLERAAWYREGKADVYDRRPIDIGLRQASGVQLTVTGRIHANRQTVWAIVRKVRQEHEERQLRGKESGAERGAMRGTLQWATQMLCCMGCDLEDVIRYLDGLAEMVELEVELGGREAPGAASE